LKGNLKEIKKQFPKERVILSTEKEVTGIERITGVTNVNRHEYGYEVGIANEAAGAEILHHALEQTTITRFEIKEPTLNEIFIKTVGGDRHE
jgi:ABC-2 type transport system ATP-binding protein